MLKSSDQDPKLPNEDPLPVNQKARELGKHVATIYRWGSPRGVRGHRLRLTRIGGRTYIYHSDWVAFLEALNKDAARESQAQTHARQRDGERIDAQLDAEGF